MKEYTIFSTAPEFSKSVAEIKPEPGELAIVWIGQAGFYLVTDTGLRIAIDPYLTDYCQRMVGFRRMIPTVVSAEAFDVDVTLLSHSHEDHCDMDLLQLLSDRGSPVRVYATESCMDRITAQKLSLAARLIRRGDMVKESGVEVIPVSCNHGESAPDAVGFVIRASGHTVYFSGDTCLDEAVIAEVAPYEPEVVMLPINGEYGNLDGKDAAVTARRLKADHLIPCHYWTFVEHGAFPLYLKQNQNELCPNTVVDWLAVGDGIVLKG